MSTHVNPCGYTRSLHIRRSRVAHITVALCMYVIYTLFCVKQHLCFDRIVSHGIACQSHTHAVSLNEYGYLAVIHKYELNIKLKTYFKFKKSEFQPQNNKKTKFVPL